MRDAFPRQFVIFAWMIAGGFLLTAIPALLEVAAGGDTPLLWWSARVLGLLAYVALWLSNLFGVFVAGRGAGDLLDQATVMELHKRWALAALATTALHVLVVVGDPASGVTPLAALIPMASSTLRGPVAVGTLALWGMAAIAGSTALYGTIPRWGWRAIHASAFGTYVLALVHGVTAGSETGVPAVQALYVGTAAVLLGAVVHRTLMFWHRTRQSADRGAG